MILCCFILCIIACYLLLDDINLHNIMLKLAISAFTTFSALSLTFSLFLFAGINFIVFEICFIALPLGIIIKRWKKSKGTNGLYQSIKNFPFTILVTVLLGLLVFSYRFFTIAKRWGEWDAWAIWSQHAKFLSDADHFANLFTNEIAWTHPDYPLMLPSLIAMVWKSFGNTAAITPALWSYTTAFTTIALIASSFFERKFWLSGVVIVLLFSGTSLLFPYVTNQFSDTLLAAFILLPFVLLNHFRLFTAVVPFVLLGFLTASSVWIKNEGLMFYALFSICFAIKYLGKLKIVGAYIVGSLLPLIVFAIFKIFFAPSGDLLSAKSNYLELIIDSTRYEFILNFAANYFVQNAVLLLCLLVIVLVLLCRFYISLPFIVIFLLFLSYLGAYVVSPYGLEWHMTTSFDRLVHQLVPATFYSLLFANSERWSTSKVVEDDHSTAH